MLWLINDEFNSKTLEVTSYMIKDMPGCLLLSAVYFSSCVIKSTSHLYTEYCNTFGRMITLTMCTFNCVLLCLELWLKIKRNICYCIINLSTKEIINLHLLSRITTAVLHVVFSLYWQSFVVGTLGERLLFSFLLPGFPENFPLKMIILSEHAHCTVYEWN